MTIGINSDSPDVQSANVDWYRFDTVNVAGIDISVASRAELLSAAIHDSNIPNAGKRSRVIFDANGQGVSLAASNREFAEALSQADIIHADGGFLVTASRLLTDKPLPERSATTDMIHDFAKSSLTHFLLGATEEVNAGAAKALLQIYPDMKIVGRRNGYFSQDEESAIIESINASGPDILWVGLGKPKEQQFCIRNRHRLKVSWIITCGGCYNFLTGDYSRAPIWLQNLNLEWVHRLLTRPKALGWRYLTTSPHAIWLVLKQAAS